MRDQRSVVQFQQGAIRTARAVLTVLLLSTAVVIGLMASLPAHGSAGSVGAAVVRMWLEEDLTSRGIERAADALAVSPAFRQKITLALTQPGAVRAAAQPGGWVFVGAGPAVAGYGRSADSAAPGTIVLDRSEPSRLVIRVYAGTGSEARGVADLVAAQAQAWLNEAGAPGKPAVRLTLSGEEEAARGRLMPMGAAAGAMALAAILAFSLVGLGRPSGPRPA